MTIKRITAVSLSVIIALSAMIIFVGCMRTPEYKADDITAVALSCGSGSTEQNYSFSLVKVKSKWYLTAECFIEKSQKNISIENVPIDETDAGEVTSIIESKNLIELSDKQTASDEKLNYRFLLRFSDGKSRYTSTPIDDAVKQEFYRLAEKYGVK